MRSLRLMAAMALVSMGLATEVDSDDPPRRRKNISPQIDILPEPAMHEPEVLSKRAQRRARGREKEARRG